MGQKAMQEQTKTAMMTPTGRETNTIIINNFLDSIDYNYISFSVLDPGLDMPSLRRVGKGGLAMY
jgi:hypothetical protein